MKRFLIKASVFFVLMTGFYFVIDLIKMEDSVYSNSFLSAIADKHRRIGEISSPKIILGGGSNLAFGIDSAELQLKTGIPVVNFGLHAGLGLDFILNELEHSIKDNDTVFLSFEYYLPGDGTYSYQKMASNAYPDASNFYKHDYFMDFQYAVERNNKKFKSIFTHEFNQIELERAQKKQRIYNRALFNENGDFIGHLYEANYEQLTGKKQYVYEYWSGIEKINHFNKVAKAKNVRVFYFYPPYPESEFHKNEKALNLLDHDLKKNLEVLILNSPKDVVFPDNYFYDTVYHLNAIGRKVRTDRLVDLVYENQIFK
jgi:hypothetical protein